MTQKIKNKNEQTRTDRFVYEFSMSGNESSLKFMRNGCEDIETCLYLYIKITFYFVSLCRIDNSFS